MKIKNMIKETGPVNGLVQHLESIEVQKDRYVLRFKNFGTHHDLVIDRATGTIYDIMADGSLQLKRRLSLHYLPFKGASKTMQGSISHTLLIAVVGDIVANNGNTMSSYTGMEGNHKVPQCFEHNNSESNLELCSKTQNCRHWSAWNKTMQISGEVFRFELSALDTYAVQFILDKATELSSKSSSLIVLFNSKLKRTLEIRKDPDDVWRRV